MLWYSCKRIFALFGAILIVALSVFGVRLLSVCKLRALTGERTFYVYTPSSQAGMRSVLTWQEWLFVTGESVGIELCSIWQAKTYAQEVLNRYGGEILFEEQSGDVTCIYAYSKQLGGGVSVYGKRVNLHVALRGKVCVVGTPIIFGGY